jgi:hypothetical protein
MELQIEIPAHRHYRAIVIWLILTTVIAFFLLSGKAAQAGSSADCLDHFLVRSGDTLTGIADFYGFSWQVLADLNNLKPPYSLYAGQWLCLPAAVGAQEAASTPYPSDQVRFRAMVTDNQIIQVETQNFPLRTMYVVRITRDEAVRTYPWFRLGSLRVKSDSNIQAFYYLPPGLQNISPLLICLKNIASNESTCLTITN